MEKEITGVIYGVMIIGLLFLTVATVALVMNKYGEAIPVDSFNSQNNTLLDNGSSTTLSPIGDNIDSISITRLNNTWLNFDGVDEFVNLTRDFNNITSNFTLLVFINSTNLTTINDKNIITRNLAGSREWVLGTRSSNVTRLLIYTPAGGTYVSASGGTPLIENQWNMIGARFTDYEIQANTSIYYNGNIDGTQPNSSTTRGVFGNADVLIGRSQTTTGQEYFKGGIDEVRIYNSSLDRKQISRIYNETSIGGGLGKSIPVLSYHKIESSCTLSTEVCLENFTSQMQWLNDNGYKTITYDQWLSWREGDLLLPKKSIILNFDDGWLSTYTNASDIMENYGFVGVVGIILDRPDVDSNYMNWSEIQYLKDLGWQIASHNLNASSLWNMSSWEQSFNLSKIYLDGNLTNQNTTLWIYPNNDNNDTTDKICSNYYTFCSGHSTSTNQLNAYLYKNANLTYEDGNPIGLRRMIINNITTLQEFVDSVDYYNNLVLYLSLNENQGTTVYDLSGLGNNGTINGATWDNDAENISLTNNIDYTLNTNSGQFTLINPLLSWSEINFDWSYGTSSSVAKNITLSGETTLADNTPILGLLLTIIFLSVVIVILFKFTKSSKRI